MEKLKNSFFLVTHSDVSEHPDLAQVKSVVVMHRNTLPHLIAEMKEYCSQAFGKVYIDVCQRHLAEFSQSEEEAFVLSMNKNVLRMFDVLARVCIEHFESCIKFFHECDTRYSKKEGKWEKEPLLKKKRFFSFFKVLRELREAFSNLSYIPEDELFIQPRDSPRWKALDSITTIVEPDTKDKCIESSFIKAKSSMALWGTIGKEAQFLPKTEQDMDKIMEQFSKCADVIHAKGFEFVDKVDQDNRDNCDDFGFRFMIRMNHYKNNDVKCLTDGLFMISQGDNVLLRKMFNFIEKGSVKFLRRKFEFPSIEHNIKLYLKPDILEQNFSNDKRSPIKIKVDKISLTDEELLPETLTIKDPNSIRIRFMCDTKLKNLESRFKSTTNKKDSQSSPTKSSPGKESSFKPMVPSPKAETEISSDCEVSATWLEPNETSTFDNVLIYMHGGGFVAMSSSSHQNYLLKWSKEMNLPIFAVDYRLAPGTKYPELPNDVFRSYVWILAFLTQVLKVNPKKIIISGDSAGGNLCALLTNWCIENRVRKPDFVLMSYPATDLNSKRFTPSQVYSFGDFLLSYNGLRMCEAYYVPEWARPKEDYYLSPVVTPRAILSQYPPCAIMVTERDPLNDDGFRFAEKLQVAGAPISVFYFKSVIHGQLNFALTSDQGIPQAHRFEEQARELLCNVIGKKIMKSEAARK